MPPCSCFFSSRRALGLSQFSLSPSHALTFWSGPHHSQISADLSRLPRVNDTTLSSSSASGLLSSLQPQYAFSMTSQSLKMYPLAISSPRVSCFHMLHSSATSSCTRAMQQIDVLPASLLSRVWTLLTCYITQISITSVLACQTTQQQLRSAPTSTPFHYA